MGWLAFTHLQPSVMHSACCQVLGVQLLGQRYTHALHANRGPSQAGRQLWLQPHRCPA